MGKGTFAKRVAPVLGLHHISAGDLLRENVKQQTPVGRLCAGFLKEGELVPGNVVVDIVKEKVNQLKHSPTYKGYILDGFPRCVEQAELWASEGDGTPDLAVNITLNHDVLVTKLTSRRVCDSCGDNYNLADIRYGQFDMPPMLPKIPDVCDSCGGRLAQREDDKEETVKKRLRLHAATEGDLLAWFRERTTVVDFQVVRGIKQTDELIDLVRGFRQGSLAQL